MKLNDLRESRAALVAEMRTLADKAETTADDAPTTSTTSKDHE